MLIPLVICLTAHADMVRPPPEDKRFATYALRVEGLEGHPGHVILAIDDGATVSSYRGFSVDKPEHDLAAGGRNRGGGLSNPKLKLMTADAYATWSAAAGKAVHQQRKACNDRGEGCVHISRFVPRYPAPTATVDCGHAIKLRTTSAADGPDRRLESVKLVEASATACRVEPLGVQETGGGLSADAPPTPHKGSAPDTPDAPPADDSRQCAAATTTASLATGLLMVLGVAVRRRR